MDALRITATFTDGQEPIIVEMYDEDLTWEHIRGCLALGLTLTIQPV